MRNLARSELIRRLKSLSREEILGLEPVVRRRAIHILRLTKHEEIDGRCSQIAVDEVDGHLVAREDVGCLYWLQNHTKTYDEHWLAKGSPQNAPFPKDKSYFRFLIGAYMYPILHPPGPSNADVLFLPKSREMMVSWLSAGFIAWMCQWLPGTFWIIQSQKEDKAAELVKYVRTLWAQQDPGLKERHPIEYDTFLEIGWKNGSRVMGVAQGEDQARTYHPFGVFFDEAAFMPAFQQSLEAARPVTKFLLAVSTANPGYFADQCMP